MEVILSEVHDFSRAVDGLVKEIYLGMIFLQLQVRLEYEKHFLIFYLEMRLTSNLPKQFQCTINEDIHSYRYQLEVLFWYKTEFS